MPLEPGTRLGPYEVVAALGAGGMGEVYRARDTKLHRDVALKILPAAFAGDADRLARFTREAHTLAALNHSNIAHIHGLEDSGGVHALVMELVDGEDLAQRIARGPVPVDEAIAIGRQIADALEAAHEQGIIHRDLKPSNIKVRPDGAVKVLDFGLAKAMEHGQQGGPSSALSLSPTLTSPAMTAVGMIMGTAAYMAPEQAKGKPIDKRVDIWAFGVVVCEMLAGRPLFEGETVTDVLASVIMTTPDLAALPPAVPAHVRRLLARCLEKDPKLRLRDIGEARLALAAPASQFASATAVAHDRPSASGVSARWMWVSAMALAAALLVTGMLVWRATRAQPARPVVRYDVMPPDGTRLAMVSRPNVALSPDGSVLVFVAAREGTPRLYVRRRDEIEPSVIPGSEGASSPTFSPDGTEVAFTAVGNLRKARLDGPVIQLAEATMDADSRGIAWLPDGTIVYAPAAAGPLFQVPATGGKPRPLTKLDDRTSERTHRWPAALPGGKALLFTVGSVSSPDNYDGSTIEAVVVATGERKVVMQGASSARYADEHLLFGRGALLFAVPFDVDRLATTGEPVQVLQGVSGDTTTGAAHLTLGGDGTLAYVSGGAQIGFNRLMWADRKGAAQTLPLPPGVYLDPRISPDGTRAAVAWQSVGGASADVWVADVVRNTFTRLSFTGNSGTPVWSPDGNTIYYVYFDPSGLKSTIMRKPADGSHDAEAVASLNSRVYLNAISSDGTSALLDYRHLKGGAYGSTDVMKVALDATAKLEPLVAAPFDEYDGAWSPDQRLLAYQSNETGRFEIYVRDMKSSGGRWQVSTNGGEEPHWSADGRELFYRDDERLMAVAVDTRATFVPQAPVMLFDGIYNLRSDSGISFGVDPKTGRFLMIRLASDNTAPPGIRVVLNWFQDLRRLTTRDVR